MSFGSASSPGGRNYGWRRMEGAHCFNPSRNCNDGTLVLPIVEYSHEEGCSITGGFRYRGEAMPDFFGTYFFGDFCSGRIWGAAPSPETGEWTRTGLLDTSIASRASARTSEGSCS